MADHQQLLGVLVGRMFPRHRHGSCPGRSAPWTLTPTIMPLIRKKLVSVSLRCMPPKKGATGNVPIGVHGVVVSHLARAWKGGPHRLRALPSDTLPLTWCPACWLEELLLSKLVLSSKKQTPTMCRRRCPCIPLSL